jgi:hypothetical protein
VATDTRSHQTTSELTGGNAGGAAGDVAVSGLPHSGIGNGRAELACMATSVPQSDWYAYFRN